MVEGRPVGEVTVTQGLPMGMTVPARTKTALRKEEGRRQHRLDSKEDRTSEQRYSHVLEGSGSDDGSPSFVEDTGVEIVVSLRRKQKSVSEEVENASWKVGLTSST